MKIINLPSKNYDYRDFTLETQSKSSEMVATLSLSFHISDLSPTLEAPSPFYRSAIPKDTLDSSLLCPTSTWQLQHKIFIEAKKPLL